MIARSLSKRYGPIHALTDFSLEIQRGEVFCLLGPNGSGKTTFMRMLAGFMSPSSGSLAVAGFDVVKHSMDVRRRIGYVPESVPLYRQMRVAEFLSFMARLRGVAESQVQAAVARVAEQLALSDRLRSPIATLSRGYRQRVAIAQALVHDPELLILDEPSNGLDPRQIIDMRLLIRGLAGRHTVLMSSHILAEVEKTADRVAVLLGGHLKGLRVVDAHKDRSADAAGSKTENASSLEDWYLSLS